MGTRRRWSATASMTPAHLPRPPVRPRARPGAARGSLARFCGGWHHFERDDLCHLGLVGDRPGRSRPGAAPGTFRDDARPGPSFALAAALRASHARDAGAGAEPGNRVPDEPGSIGLDAWMGNDARWPGLSSSGG